MSNGPERIWATVNGMRRAYPGGEVYLIGGWEDLSQGRGTEYVRADIADDLTTAYMAGYRDAMDKVSHQKMTAAFDPPKPTTGE